MFGCGFEITQNAFEVQKRYHGKSKKFHVRGLYGVQTLTKQNRNCKRASPDSTIILCKKNIQACHFGTECTKSCLLRQKNMVTSVKWEGAIIIAAVVLRVIADAIAKKENKQVN